MYRKVINFYILILYPVILPIILFVIITLFSLGFSNNSTFVFCLFLSNIYVPCFVGPPPRRPGLRSEASLGEPGVGRCVWGALTRLPPREVSLLPRADGAGAWGIMGWGCHQAKGKRSNSAEPRSSAEPGVGLGQPASRSVRTHSALQSAGFGALQSPSGILGNVSVREGVHFHFALGPASYIPVLHGVGMRRSPRGWGNNGRKAGLGARVIPDTTWPCTFWTRTRPFPPLGRGFPVWTAGRCDTFRAGLWGRPGEFRVEAFPHPLSLLSLSAPSWALLGDNLTDAAECANSTNRPQFSLQTLSLHVREPACLWGRLEKPTFLLPVTTKTGK